MAEWEQSIPVIQIKSSKFLKGYWVYDKRHLRKVEEYSSWNIVSIVTKMSMAYIKNIKFYTEKKKTTLSKLNKNNSILNIFLILNVTKNKIISKKLQLENINFYNLLIRL